MGNLLDKMSLWLDKPFLDNPTWIWLAAVGLALLVVVILRIIQRVVIARLRAMAEKTKTSIDDIVANTLSKTSLIFLLSMGVLAGSLLLSLGERAESLRRVLVAVALIQAALWGVAIHMASLQRWKEKKAGDASAATVMMAVGFLGKVVIWSIVLLLALQNFGIQVTALVAGFGIGGIAIALAVQNILSDLFSSITIILDKPFEIGDFIIVGDMMGSVEHIGLKTTRIRSLTGEQLVFANSDLLSSRIRNYKRMKERRITFTLGVTYQTPAEKLEAIPGMIREIIEKQDKVRFDRAHFAKYGDFSLNFDMVYYVLEPDYAVYMNIQQAINLEIFRKFEAEKIEFAYPTQTIFMEKSGDPKPA